MTSRRPYEPNPIYPVVDDQVRRGWAEASRLAPDDGVLAVDGPMIADWSALIEGLTTHRRIGAVIDMREAFAAWDEIQKRTVPHERLRDDPDFATIPSITLADLFDDLPDPYRAGVGTTLVYGPGAALVDHDVLWYADLPKRYAEAAVTAGRGRNLGAPPRRSASTRRLFYIDWPLLDRHRDALADRIDLWLDLQDPTTPAMLTGREVRATLGRLAHSPFRTRPTFNTTSWGGHWGQRELGFNTDRPNTALGYELIAPESGILLGSDLVRAVEVPFQLAVALNPEPVLGSEVHQRFGTSFPIRFDYLDTVGGGSLSVHCHPQRNYMRSVFGWPYTQHETYYVMVGSPDNVIFLGLRDNVDVQEFRTRAHRAEEAGKPFDIFEYIQQHPATEHQLFLIPAGTPHGSGKDNVVLEISATPYLYSLRFYDWLRRDAEGRQRPVHVNHAFNNLDTQRSGPRVTSELLPQPRTLASGSGWREDLLGSLRTMFFRIHGIEITDGAAVQQHTDGRFQVLNVVSGDGVAVHSREGQHPLHFAETMVVPAAVGDYRLDALGHDPVRVVKAFVA